MDTGMRKSSLKTTLMNMAAGMTFLLIAASASAQMVAVDDRYSLQLGETLEIEEPGILDNDLLHEESAPEMGAIAVLVTDVLHGTLQMFDDGSFTYYPDASFDGTDSFVYAAVNGSYYDEATVYFSACSALAAAFSALRVRSRSLRGAFFFRVAI